jgi:hypothetical protein
MENLNSIEEWVEYINQIPMMEMIEHAKIIGSVSFEEDMESEGYEDGEIMDCYQALTKRFLTLEIRIPDTMDNACVNFRDIAVGILTPS